MLHAAAEILITITLSHQWKFSTDVLCLLGNYEVTLGGIKKKNPIPSQNQREVITGGNDEPPAMRTTDTPV